MGDSVAEHDNEVLLELVQKAYKKWKWAELNYKRQDGVYVLKNRNKIRAESLRDIYITLLLEARKRDVSMTPKQLFNFILYPSPEKEKEQF
jgi:hypothetical protein